MQKAKMSKRMIKEKLEYLRGEIVGERISLSEIIELQGLIEYIDPSDVLLLEWAGVPENNQCDVCGKELYKDKDGDLVCEDDDLHNKEEEN